MLFDPSVGCAQVPQQVRGFPWEFAMSAARIRVFHLIHRTNLAFDSGMDVRTVSEQHLDHVGVFL